MLTMAPWRAEEDQARAIFLRYLEAGGNSADTADVYGGGRSEELLGSLIAETGTRESLVLATKASAPVRPDDPNARGNGRKHLPAALQLEYSLLERTCEIEHLSAAQHTTMSLVPWSPLAGGFLTGKYTRDDDIGTGRLSMAANYPDRREHRDRDWDILDAVHRCRARARLRARSGRARLGADRPTVATTVIGATTVEQLDTNLCAASIELPPEGRRALTSVSQPTLGSPYRLFAGHNA